MIQIYRNNQPFFALEDVCDGSKMSRQLMDHHYIVLKFSTEETVYFEIGDSVEIADFGLFVLTSAYFPKYNETTDGYDYELQMDAYYMSWKNKICKYRPQYGANETSFKLTTSVSVHLNVVLSNLKALNYKYHNKDFSVDYTTYNKEVFDTEKRFLVEYSSISIIEALNTICETLDCEWWVDGSIIYLGYCEMNGQTTFEQGVNMLSMSQSESKSSFITRLYAFGSDKNIPSGYFSGADADVTTDGIATDYLMLPNKDVDEEGYYSKDGYIENVNVVKSDSQAIEGVVKFEDEYPKVSCVVSAIKTYESTVDNKDGTKNTATFWQVTSNDSFATNFETSWRKKGLNLMIRFESGALTGMEFEVSFKIIDKVNYFEIVANDTYGRTLPDSVMCPKIGDKFYLYNWDASKITDTPLIPDAQEALYVRAKNYYKKSMVDNSNFTCVLDSEKFFNNGTYNYHPLGEQVKLINPLFSDTDKDGKHYRNSRIIGYEINLDIPYDTPQYIVGEKAAYSRLGQLEEKVNSITVNGIKIGDGSGGTGGVYVIGMNDSTPASDSNVYSARRTRMSFLSKAEKDTAKETIAFEKGLTAGSYERLTSGAAINADGAAEVESIAVRRGATFGQSAYIDAAGDASLSNVSVSGVRSKGFTVGDRTLIGGKGFELYKDGSGKSHLFVDNAVIRGKLLAAATEIRKVSYSGGTMIFSNAGSTLIHVVGLDAAGHEVAADASAQAFKCWAAADDGSTRTMNWWKVGDMAMCKTFNIKDSSGGNRYYWRLVIGRGQEVLEDGKLYDYVVLSNLETFAGGDAVVPVNVVSTLTDNEGNIITFGGVVVTMVTDVVMSSLADVVSGQDGSTKDDAGIDIGTRTYYGFDPQGTDIPMAGDVIVQVGSETRFMQRGNAIKLATSADDGDARTAPSLTMYHQIGNTWSTDDGGSSVWQWKTVTAVISPTGVRFNADYFKWFSGSEDNVVDPIVISYTLTPSSTFLVRQVSTGKVEPTDITLSLTKHTGNKVEAWNDKGVTLKARYTQRDGLAGEKVIKSVKDIGDLYALLTLRVLAIDAKGQELCYTDIAIISDGEDFDVQVLAEGGNSIFNGEGTKKLTAYVYRNGQDITSTIVSTAFSWKRQSSDAADDKIWNSLHVGLGNVCTVTNEDIDRSAMFMCEVEIV